MSHKLIMLLFDPYWRCHNFRKRKIVAIELMMPLIDYTLNPTKPYTVNKRSTASSDCTSWVSSTTPKGCVWFSLI